MNRYKLKRSQAGASLVEILIGLAIGLVILTAIGTAYVLAVGGDHITNDIHLAYDRREAELAKNVSRMVEKGSASQA